MTALRIPTPDEYAAMSHRARRTWRAAARQLAKARAAAQVRAEAQHLLARITPDDPAVIEARRAELLAELQAAGGTR